MSKGEAIQRKKATMRFKKPSILCETNKMTPEQTARYLAFADPSDPKVKAMLAAVLMKDRVLVKEQEKETEQKNLVGVLKAAEARNRLRNARLQYQNLRAQEINFLISFQRNAKGAVRLEVFLPPRKNLRKLADCMNTVQRGRIEEILADETGEIFIRRP
ncbi:protein LKAAEAR1 [Rhineura floridana]|uniref:protein LKAAEAR1 n=1 Tax=Rhineura floridana TaxID=261503 RepID=UPI002AC8291F|nr:protein LKAAEAR1 [Rhineura floridana]XP_061486219.1 protein LKAAEAR1 [Rhineura floridana]XP_061486220.1 protein LKAAEAR1 [Rhineura floridana]XP_061486221.1 protein LKAAEAR1 [Rhineura floridana]XP_061486222.1 protein LKAAEAR1 [Rhineura floridana]